MSHKKKSTSGSAKQRASADTASSSQSAKEFSQNERAQGNTYFKSENFKLAIEHYSKAIDSLLASGENAELASLYNNRTIAHIKLEEWDQAVQDATKSISFNDKESKAFYRRGLAFLKLNQLSRAVQDFEHALKLSPGNQEISKALSQAKQSLSQSECNETKRTTKSTSPSPPPTFRGDLSILKKSNDFKEKGANLFKAGQHAESIGLFSQALEVLLGAKNPEFYVEQVAALYNNRAAAHSQVAQHKAAVQDCNSCMHFIRKHAGTPLPSNLAPIFVKSLMRRAFAYEALEMPNQALVDMQEALALDPLSINQQAIASVGRLTNAARKHNQIVVQEAKTKGNSFFEKNDYSGAIECYTRALYTCGVSPVSPMAVTSEKARSPEEEQDVLKILASLGVQNVELMSVPIQAQVNDKAAVVSLLCNRALAFLRLRRFAAAIVDCSRALERDEHNQKALLRRGLARKGLGEHLCDRQLCLSALDDLKHANELDPKDTTSQEIATVEKLLASV